MAIVYSSEYAAAYNSVPRSRTDPNKRGYLHAAYFSYTQVGTGNAGDLLYIMKIPAGSRLLIPLCSFWFVGCPANTVFDFGYLGYTEPDGAALAASTNGLIDGIDQGGTLALWQGGMMVIGTPDDLLPAALTYHFNSREDVTLTLLNEAGDALAADDVVQGVVVYINS